MQQPELGRRLSALRKEKNLTQEELVEKSHVSVRTIQRIEAGEVLPRLITVKILLEALGEQYESFLSKQELPMKTKNGLLKADNRHVLLHSVLAGAVYLVLEIVLGTMDVAWISGSRNWDFRLNAAYIVLTLVLLVSFALFARGFLVLSSLFENSLLKIALYLLLGATVGKAVLDLYSLFIYDLQHIWIPYAFLSVVMGALSIVFGMALLRLQDGMGELSRFAGIVEIVLGVFLLTVVLFFLSYILLIPATILEILILYRGYEYLSKDEKVTVG